MGRASRSWSVAIPSGPKPKDSWRLWVSGSRTPPSSLHDLSGELTQPPDITMTINHLTPAPSTIEPYEFAGTDHPMRKVTRQVAFDNAWDAERAAKVSALFDSMAATWTADHDGVERLASLEDALDRGGPATDGPILELGSGSGLGTGILRERVGRPVIALDIAAEMLRNAPPEAGHRVHGDASQLPVADDAVSSVVLVNALLFPAEIDRVLAPEGTVVWVNTNGEQTPIHLPPEDVAEAMPGRWEGLASRAGTGIWAVLRRA